jgi:hypothetical protein
MRLATSRNSRRAFSLIGTPLSAVCATADWSNILSKKSRAFGATSLGAIRDPFLIGGQLGRAMPFVFAADGGVKLMRATAVKNNAAIQSAGPNSPGHKGA